MALLLINIQASLTRLMDKDDPLFTGYPLTNPQVANKWSDAVHQYAVLVTPVSTTAVAAKAAMINTMVSNMGAPGTFFPALVMGFTNYALTLAGGMAPGFAGIPPPSPINLAPFIALGLSPSIALSTRISTLALIIDTWFKTGTANTLPSGPTVPWS